MRASHDKSEVGAWVSNLNNSRRSSRAPPQRHMNKANIVSSLGYIIVTIAAVACVKFIAGA